jgi:hypothetical protein
VSGDTTARDLLAAALDDHELAGGSNRGVWCACGEWAGPGAEHQAHRVDALLAPGGAVHTLVEEAKAEALREAAEEMPRTQLPRSWLVERASFLGRAVTEEGKR